MSCCCEPPPTARARRRPPPAPAPSLPSFRSRTKTCPRLNPTWEKLQLEACPSNAHFCGKQARPLARVPQQRARAFHGGDERVHVFKRVVHRKRRAGGRRD